MSALINTVRNLKEHPTVKENRKNMQLEKINKNSEIDKKRKSSIKNNVKPTKKFSIDLAESINFQNTYTSQENKKENKNENILKDSFNQTFKQPVYKNRNSNVFNSSNAFRKGKTKYILNLLNDASIKKYKQSCISFLKEDDLIKNLYEGNGFEKNNFSYDNFIDKYFFNNKLFLYKLEIMLMSEEFAKKNAKEKFFKKEIINYLNNLKNEKEYIDKINILKSSFDNQFSFIKNFDLNK